MGALGSPADWIKAVRQIGFGHAVELLCLFTVCVAILLLIVKGPEWMKVIFEHRRLMREADENEKGRRFERLRDLHRMVAERKNAELEDRTDDL